MPLQDRPAHDRAVAVLRTDLCVRGHGDEDADGDGDRAQAAQEQLSHDVHPFAESGGSVDRDMMHESDRKSTGREEGLPNRRSRDRRSAMSC